MRKRKAERTVKDDRFEVRCSPALHLLVEELQRVTGDTTRSSLARRMFVALAEKLVDAATGKHGRDRVGPLAAALCDVLNEVAP